MNVLKDSGRGVTQDSIEFWQTNKGKISSVLSLECKNGPRAETDPLGYLLGGEETA